MKKGQTAKTANRLEVEETDEKKLLEAVKGSFGIVSNIAKKMGMSWHATMARIEKTPSAMALYLSEREAIIDLAESRVVKSIAEGNTQDARYILSTIGKKRGYTERHEVTGKDGEAVKVETMQAPAKMTLEEWNKSFVNKPAD